MKSHLSCSGTVRAGLSVLVLAMLLAGAGCSGNKRLTINGAVSYRGTPLSSGIVKFYGPGDRLSMAYIEPDGTFIITDLFPGEVKVTVEDDPSSRPKRSGTDSPANGGTPGKRLAVPRKYTEETTSGLVYTITSGTRNLDIKLD
jgi:hypothetical protein